MARQYNKQNTEAPQKKSTGSANRNWSKKQYQARNKDWALTNRNKASQAARRKRRKEYWESKAGQARKAKKMNSPEKVKAREEWKVRRDVRRRERRLEEQKAGRTE